MAEENEVEEDDDEAPVVRIRVDLTRTIVVCVKIEAILFTAFNYGKKRNDLIYRNTNVKP